jgi:hypothetical protein
MILQRVDLLLGHDREMDGYTRAVSGQRLGKHIPAAAGMNATIEALFSMWPVPICYKQGARLELSQFCTGVCEERTWALESDEYPLLEAVVRKRLVETLQAEKSLAGAVVICELWRLAVAPKLLTVPSRVYKWSINPFTDPNPVYSNTYETTWQY